MLVVNKSEGMRYASVAADFYELGLGDPCVISAAHGDGVPDLVESALDELIENTTEAPDQPEHRGIRIAIVGRPNVGKSTMVNALLGEERVIAFDMPGTTRDSIEIPFERDGRHYALIDTAGIRRKGKVFEAIEKFSVVKTLKSIADANVVLLLLDAQQDISEQDAHIAGFVLEAGRALVVGVNKWDGLDQDTREHIKREIERKLSFLSFAKMHFISATKGTGIPPMMKSINAAYEAAMRNLPTPQLTRALQEAVEHQQPRRKGSVRPKLRYAHQGGQNPPIIIVHGNALDAIDPSYKRYLEKHFRESFGLVGTPLRIEFRSGKNPFSKTD